MTGLALDLRITLRSLIKTPGILAISLLAIALGVGVNTAMFSVVNAVLLRALPYPQPERLVALWPEKRWGMAMLNDVLQREDVVICTYDIDALTAGQALDILRAHPVAIIEGTLSDNPYYVPSERLLRDFAERRTAQ